MLSDALSGLLAFLGCELDLLCDLSLFLFWREKLLARFLATFSCRADLLNLLTVLLGDQCKKTFQSVCKMKLFMREYFGSKEPTKINYCANCFNRVEDRCHKAG